MPPPEAEAPGELLVVENDERIANLMAWFLERRGHRVQKARSFHEARRCIEARRPELVLSDLDLGGESGRDELPRLAEAGLLPPTLVVSGYVDADTARELRAIPGVVGILPKPFELARLEALVGELLGRIRRAPATPRPTAAP
ncbi:MAG TPA: response regulator [Planctomycetota bacterium]|nr:response regulator [Planctomycetota bacterium]